MAGKTMVDVFDSFKHKYLNDVKDNEFFQSSSNILKNSEMNVNLTKHYLLQDVDLAWVEKIESCIIPLDNIIRQQRRFIKNEEEIVPIALSRSISKDSIVHLATHTNLIDSYDGDTVLPQKILNIRKEESFETYENRFAYTLLNKLAYFLDKRLNIIKEKTENINEYNLAYSGTCKIGKDQLQYNFELNYKTPNKTEQEDLESLINQNTDVLSNIERVERLRKIISTFQSSQLMKALFGCPQVKPPLTMTNVLRKNPDFQEAVSLWQYIETYEGLGVKLALVDKEDKPDTEFMDELLGLAVTQYVTLKKHTSDLLKVSIDKEVEEADKFENITEKLSEYVEVYDFDLEKFSKIIIEQLLQQKKKRKAEEKYLMNVIKMGLKFEDEKEKIRKEILKKKKLALKEKLALQKKREQERLKKEKEKEKLLQQKIAQELKLQKQQEALELKKEQEALKLKQLEEERLEKERLKQEQEELEAQRLKALEEEKRLEEERLQKEEQERLEKEKNEKAEQERIAKEEEYQKYIETLKAKPKEELTMEERQAIIKAVLQNSKKFNNVSLKEANKNYSEMKKSSEDAKDKVIVELNSEESKEN